MMVIIIIEAYNLACGVLNVRYSKKTIEDLVSRIEIGYTICEAYRSIQTSFISESVECCKCLPN